MRSIMKTSQAENLIRPVCLSSNQAGSALIVSLIMLLLITLVAVAGMQTTIMQERMSANFYDRDLAFQAAESALREGEQFVLDGSLPVFSNSNGLYQINSNNRPVWGGGTSNADTAALAYLGDLDGVFAQPEYFIEQIDTFQPAGTETETGVAAPEVTFFRITARGFGGSSDTQVIVTSVVRAR